MELFPGEKKQISTSKIGIIFPWDAIPSEIPLNLDFSAMILEKNRYKFLVNYRNPKIDFVEWIPDISEEQASGFVIDFGKAGADVDMIMLFGFISFAESRKHGFNMLGSLQMVLTDLSGQSESYTWKKKSFAVDPKTNGNFICQLSKKNGCWEFKITDTAMELPNISDLIKAYK